MRPQPKRRTDILVRSQSEREQRCRSSLAVTLSRVAADKNVRQECPRAVAFAVWKSRGKKWPAMNKKGVVRISTSPHFIRSENEFCSNISRNSRRRETLPTLPPESGQSRDGGSDQIFVRRARSGAAIARSRLRRRTNHQAAHQPGQHRLPG